jgi:hypothetical protein
LQSQHLIAFGGAIVRRDGVAADVLAAVAFMWRDMMMNSLLHRPALATHLLCVGDSWPSFAPAFSVI